ncbi:MAG: CBS domain-containing protein [Actinobacteria bacterium]|nr:CBS domain-containing protein [Actinomycetota bacterium]
MTTVREIMTKDPVTLPASASITDAAKEMKKGDFGDVLIDNDGTLGIVTDRDIAVLAVAEGKFDCTIGDIGTFDLETVAPDDDVRDVLREMRQDDIRRVPVVEDGTAVGILSIGDLAVMFDDDSVLADISAAPADH